MLVDPEIVQCAAKGDSGAFNQLVTAYRRRVLGIISRLIARTEEIEDVGQEVFTRLFFSLQQLRTPEGFDAWVYRMTVNACYDHLRRHRRRPESRMADLSEQQIVQADSAAAHVASQVRAENNAVREQVQTLLDAVSVDDRALLIMKEVEGLSLRELSEVYRVNENALKVRLYRARQRVLKAMGEKKP